MSHHSVFCRYSVYFQLKGRSSLPARNAYRHTFPRIELSMVAGQNRGTCTQMMKAWGGCSFASLNCTTRVIGCKGDAAARTVRVFTMFITAVWLFVRIPFPLNCAVLSMLLKARFRSPQAHLSDGSAFRFTGVLQDAFPRGACLHNVIDLRLCLVC